MTTTTAKPSREEKQEVLSRAEQAGIKFVSLQFTDILGLVKNITIPLHKFGDAIDYGLWFDGSSIEGFARIHESDMYLEPDLTTFGPIPWETQGNPTAKVICNVFTPEGEEFAGDPRNVLRRAEAEASRLGYLFQTGPELEFFLLRAEQPGAPGGLPHDRAGYFDVSSDEASEVRKEMVNALESQGITVEASHHEVAPGQHEIDFRYGRGLATADNAMTFKVTMKAIAERHGLYATFMPKPFFGINGSGMHTHMSLADLQSGKNLFYDGNNEYGLST
jgi:glutamine synthetase